ncbi:MAG: hypothetical protein LQ337_007116 [Flavoplaca oasis]|nr:MAG: hypothetical protein LQ337_007116 [Flavoplaca oasis]
MVPFVGTNVVALVLACNTVDVPLGDGLDERAVDDDTAGEKGDDVVLWGRAEGVVGLAVLPRPRLRHRSPVHPSAAVGFIVVFNGLDMGVGGCVAGEEVVLVLTEEEVDEDKGDVAELVRVFNEFVEEFPPLDSPSETNDDVTRLVGVFAVFNVVLPSLPPNVGKLAPTHSSPEHSEPEACTDGEELALPEPVAIVIDDGNDGGVVIVVDGAFPSPMPRERQRSPVQVDIAEGDNTVARVVATLLPDDEEGGDRVNVCVIV